MCLGIQTVGRARTSRTARASRWRAGWTSSAARRATSASTPPPSATTATIVVTTLTKQIAVSICCLHCNKIVELYMKENLLYLYSNQVVIAKLSFNHCLLVEVSKQFRAQLGFRRFLTMCKIALDTETFKSDTNASYLKVVASMQTRQSLTSNH